MRKNSSVLLHTSSYSNLNGNITLITRKWEQPSDGMLVPFRRSVTVALILYIGQDIFQKLLLDGG